MVGVESVGDLLSWCSCWEENVVIVESIHEDEPQLEDDPHNQEDFVSCAEGYGHITIIFL